MRRSVTWLLGLILVLQLLHVINMLQFTYMRQKRAPNEEVLRALIGEYDGWTLAGIFGAVGLVLFVILTTAVRRDLKRASRPESPARPNPGDGLELPPR
jgi:uncharacterized membrane protein